MASVTNNLPIAILTVTVTVNNGQQPQQQPQQQPAATRKPGASQSWRVKTQMSTLHGIMIASFRSLIITMSKKGFSS